MLEKLKNTKGITMIALVITIIILLILAGVAISAIAGDNGLLNRVQQAKEKNNIETAREKLIIAIDGIWIDKQRKVELEELNQIKEKGIIIKQTADGKVEINEEKETKRKYAIANVDGYDFKIYDNLEIKLIGESQENLGNLEELKKGYVQDGLMVWYDGVLNNKQGHSNDTKVWENLAQDEIDGQLIDINNTNESGWTENSLILDGIDDWVRMKEIPLENMTVEIVAKQIDMDTSKVQHYITNNQNGGLGIYKNKNNLNACQIWLGNQYSKSNSNENIKIGQKYSLSAGYNGEYQYLSENGKLVKKGVTEKYKEPEDNSVFAIGTGVKGNNKENVSGGEISNIEVYSVRIYNRCLTDEEINKNYNTDVKRFNIEKAENNQDLGYVKDGLVSLYDGEQNTIYGHTNKATQWMDITGNNIHGIISGATWGKNYLSFDGIDDWVNCERRDYDNPTIEVVALYRTLPTTETVLAVNFQSGGYGLKVNPQKSSFQFNVGGTYYTARSTNIPSINKIYSLSGSYDGQDGKLYENGTLFQTNKVGTIKKPSYSTVLGLGANPYGSIAEGNYLAGNIYCVRIYNRALTQKEVMQNYEIDKKRFGIQ